MVLSEEATVIYARDESVTGTDSLSALTEAQRATYAQSVTEVSYQGESEFDDTTELGSGTQSKGASAVGRESATMTFGMRMRGAGGVSGRRPPWAPNLLAAGWREDSTNVYKSTLTMIGTYTGATDPDAALLWCGERLLGEIAVTAATGAWETAEYTGAGTPTDSPETGTEVVFYAAGGSATDPIAVGTLVRDFGDGSSGTSTHVRVKLNAGETGIPVTGCNVRAFISAGNYAYNTVSATPFVGHVLKFTNAGTGSAGTLYYYHAAGEAPTNARSFVGQQTGVEATFNGVPAAHGFAYLPESRSTIKLTDTGGGWITDAPDAGTIVVQVNDDSNIEAAGKVISVDGNNLVIKPFTLFGAFATTSGTAQTIYEYGTSNYATMYVSESIGSPSRSIYYVVDGFLRKLVGARGNAEIELTAGSPGRITFAWEGSVGSSPQEIEISHPTSLTLPTWAPPKWESGIAEVQGVRHTIRGMTFTTDQQVSRRSSANAPGGTLGASSEERGTPAMTVELDRLGTLDPWESYRRNATPIVAGAVLGSTENDSIAIAVTNGQVKGNTDGTDERRITTSVNVQLNGVTGDDEVIIAAI